MNQKNAFIATVQLSEKMAIKMVCNNTNVTHA
jgi:hypothetical protein